MNAWSNSQFGSGAGCGAGESASSAPPVERPFAVTFFEDHGAARKHEERSTLCSLAGRIRVTSAARKDLLPWLKLARFGDLRTGKGCLRHDANLLAASGVEADYDGEEMAFGAAVEVLGKAGVLALVYTSPSHADGAPRWRVLCPLSAEAAPERRDHLLGRLNGLFGGAFSAESWTRSQAYYYGNVASNPAHRVEVVDGTPLDLLDDLDEVWCGKAHTAEGGGGQGQRRSGPLDEAALLAEITTGSVYHEPMVRLLGRWARDGVPFMAARGRLFAAMDEVPETKRDGRWQARRDDIDRCLEDIYVKEGKARDRGRRAGGDGSRGGTARADTDPDVEPWPEPVDFLAEGDLTGVPALRPGHLPEALHGFVADTAERMGVDPVGVGLSALVACASMVSEEWELQPKVHDDDWTERARLWGAIVGDPSILKTPVIKACTRPIERFDAEGREHHALAMRRHKAAVAEWKASGSDPDAEPRAPRLARYLVEGSTVEALSEVLRDDAEAKQRAPTGKVLVRQDEMSDFFANLDRYRAGGRGGGDRGAYLRLHNGGRFVMDRVLRGSFACSNWSACFLGGIQPGPIQAVAKDAADDGLLQRFLFCVPGRQEEGVDRAPNRGAVRRYEALFPALVALHPARPVPGETEKTIVLHCDAHPHRLALNQTVRAIAAMPDASNRLKSALGKWPGVFARIALTFHMIELADVNVRGGTLPPVAVVPEATARRAAAFLREIALPHLLRADRLMFATAQTGHARWIAGLILARGQPRIALRDVVQAYGALRPPEARRELLDVMESLVTVGWLRPEPQSNPARPPAAWAVNPAVFSVFAERAEREREGRRHAQEAMGEAIRRHQTRETA